MNRETLERHQIFVYLTSIAIGLFAGIRFPELGEIFELALWPVLGCLLYATFTQVPLIHLREAVSKPRFIVVATLGNFLIIPAVVWVLFLLTPDDPAIRLGLLLVLLVPCTDWFITFTQLGGGDTHQAIAFSPVSLLLQILLLPFYIWLFMGAETTISLARMEMLLAFAIIILAPLMAAYATEKLAEKSARSKAIMQRIAVMPVPLLALVVFMIAASQVDTIAGSLDSLGYLALLFVVFLTVALLIARLLATSTGLSTGEARTLAFSLGSRNSFVVLPLALALPAHFELAVVVIVLQSLIELFGMMVYLWLVPKVVFKSR